MVDRWIWYAVFLFLLALSAAQNLDVYGEFALSSDPLTTRNIEAIYATCFKGIGLVTCDAELPADDYVESTELELYRTLANNNGQYYCVSCCGTPLDNIDVWNMRCSVDSATQTQVNVYGYELRMARRMSLKDTAVITCPLRRSACNYTTSGELIQCNRASDTSYLVGYTATIIVNRYTQDFKYFNGVSECNIESMEANESLAVSGDDFIEQFILVHKPISNPELDSFKYFFIFFSLIFILYFVLYFCRRKRCVYCNSKLVFSPRLCYKCVIVGAELPDPVLMATLEQKGAVIQGDLPERFPFANFVTTVFRNTFCFLCASKQPKLNPNRIVVVPVDASAFANSLDLNETDRRISSSPPMTPDPNKLPAKSRWWKRWIGLEKRRENPNTLHYDPEIVAAAVMHPAVRERASALRQEIRFKKLPKNYSMYQPYATSSVHAQILTYKRPEETKYVDL